MQTSPAILRGLSRSNFLVSRERAVVCALPRAQEIEAAEFLRKLHRLINDALLLLVVADLDETRQREVLAKRVTAEAVIRKKAAQIQMAFEQNAVEIVSLPLYTSSPRETGSRGSEPSTRRPLRA